MGLPTAVPLKHVSLNQEEQETIASTEVIGTARRKQLFVTRHFAWPVSLGLHVFAGFLLTIYAITEYIPDPEPVSLDFVEIPREPRPIIRQPQIKPTKPPDTLVFRTPRVRQTPTAVEIPTEKTEQFHTPQDDLVDTDAAPTSGVSLPEGIGDIQVEQGRAEIPTEAPGVKIDRGPPSIAPEDSDMDIGEDAGLDERPIDAEVEVEVDQNPRVLRRVEPKYPGQARRAQREGVVEVEATVGVDGRATDIKVVKEDPKGFGFGDAAIEAVKRWHFTPAKRGTESVPKRVKIPIRFSLKD